VSSSTLSPKMAALSASDGPLGEFAVTIGFANKSAVLGIRGGQPSHRHLAAEQSIEGDLVDVEPHKLPRCLGMTTSTPPEDDGVDSAPHLVVAWARATVGGADGVSVSLRRCDRSRRSSQPFREHAADIMASTQRPRLESGPESTDRHDG